MISSRILQINFLVALAGVLGSLFFSEILKFPPCVLCWYQRIFLYPLAAIFGVALWTGDRYYFKYAIPFCALGLVFSSYHNLLYFGIIPEALTPCTEGVSCSSRQLELFGFITIPLLSMASFIAMSLLVFIDMRCSKENT